MSNDDEEIGAIKQNFSTLLDTVDKKIQELQDSQKRWAEIEANMEEHLSKLSEPITLNIGGTLFDTSKTTLLSQKGTFFDAMLSSGRWKPDANGRYFIDRDPLLFPVILNYLRTGKLCLKRYSFDVTNELKQELDFYIIEIPEVLRPPISKLLTCAQYTNLIEWTGKSSFTVLYSATSDGFGANIFHQKCDNKGPTVTLVRSSNGHLFGGYNSLSWDCSDAYKSAPGSFLFTLTNPHNIPPTKYLLTANGGVHTTYNAASYGPTFGGGHDLYIASNANTTNCGCNFPNSFTDSTGKGRATFTSPTSFTVSEIEVFLVN